MYFRSTCPHFANLGNLKNNVRVTSILRSQIGDVYQALALGFRIFKVSEVAFSDTLIVIIIHSKWLKRIQLSGVGRYSE